MHLLDRLLWTAIRVFPAAPSGAYLDALRPGPDDHVGPDWPHRYAARTGGRAVSDPQGGLLPSLDPLSAAVKDGLEPRIALFYERTAACDLSLETRWWWPFRLGAAVFARGWSRRWGQLELPQRPEALSNEIYRLDGADPCTVWVRRYEGTGRILYVSRYDTVRAPAELEPCVRVIFPVPGGIWAVVFRVARDGAALVLTEDGGVPGGAGLYLVPDGGPPRYIRAFREEIAVRATPSGVEAEHRFWLAGLPFLTLRYGIPLHA